MTKKQRYLSYLLRLWQISDGKKQIWRASLQSPNSAKRQGFASVEELKDFLDAQTGGETPVNRGEVGKRGSSSKGA